MNAYASSTAKFYRHSGRAPLMGLILVGLAGLVAVPILGLIYGVLIRFIPFVYINGLIVLGYVFAISFILSKAAKIGKVRNPILMGLAALFFGVLADYVGWVSWLAAVFRDPLFLVEFFFPFDILYYISLVAQEGAWTISGTTPTGGILYTLWLLEAIAVIGGTTYIVVTGELAETPFCEESDAWAEKRSQIGVFKPIANPVQFKHAIAQGDFSAFFRELKLAQQGDMQFTSLEVNECEHCRQFATLDVRNVALKVDKKGNVETKIKPIISKLIVTPHQLTDLRKLSAAEASSVSQ